MRTKTSKYYIFIMIMYLFVFQFGIMQIIPFFQYWDDLFALFCIALWAMHFRFKITIRKKLIESKLIALISLFIVIGLISSFIYRYQVYAAVIEDVFLNLKFFLGIGTTFLLFRNYDISQNKMSIKFHIKLILFVLFVMVLLNKYYDIFPTSNSRFGLKSEFLFFSHPTNFAAIVFFLLMILVLLYENKINDFVFIVIAVLLMMSTLRFKAIATALAFLYFYFIIIIQKKRLRLRYFVVLIPFVLMLAWAELAFYFFSDSTMDTARGALTFTSVSIAEDHFPLGSGFATFASYPSSDYYSDVYKMYHINTVWGLSKDWSVLASDVFWPMILGQTGVLGLIVYILIVVQLFKLIHLLYKIDRRYYLAGIGVLIYLLISSIAESAFVNPIAVPLSIILGISFCKLKRSRV